MSVLLRETGSPLKQGEFWAPNALQKSDFDCQRSVSLERVAFRGREALVCSAGAKGELRMSTSWQDSHTLEQKLSLFWPAVELQSIGTDRASDSVLNSFAENGSQLAQRMDLTAAAQEESEMFMASNCFCSCRSSAPPQHTFPLYGQNDSFGGLLLGCLKLVQRGNEEEGHGDSSSSSSSGQKKHKFVTAFSMLRV